MAKYAESAVFEAVLEGDRDLARTMLEDFKDCELLDLETAANALRDQTRAVRTERIL